MVFIEAGGKLNDAAIVTEGVDVFRKPSLVNRPDCIYNLANGLAELARLQDPGKPGRLDTADQRQEVRTLFQQAADKSEHPSIRSSSLNNLANQLKDSYRWIEAYDMYAAAISADPANAVALSGIASLLRWRLLKKKGRRGWSHPPRCGALPLAGARAAFCRSRVRRVARRDAHRRVAEGIPT